MKSRPDLWIKIHLLAGLLELQYEPSRQDEHESLNASRQDHMKADLLMDREETADLERIQPPATPHNGSKD